MSQYGCHGHQRHHHGHHHGSCGCGHRRHHDHGGCHDKLPIHCTPFDLCVDRLRNRLAHLGGNLGFELHRFIGCRVVITHSCGESLQEVTGKICGVGGTLVHIRTMNEEAPHEFNQVNTHHVVSIPIHLIVKIKWLDKKCNPCTHHCKCGCCNDHHDDGNHHLD